MCFFLLRFPLLSFDFAILLFVLLSQLVGFELVFSVECLVLLFLGLTDLVPLFTESRRMYAMILV